MILVTEFMDAAAVDRLRAAYPTEYAPQLADNQTEIPARLANIRALIVRNRTVVSAELLDAAPRLQCVGRLGVGLDNIDLDACRKRGVTVYPAKGANNAAVAEYVITSAGLLLRGAYHANTAMLNGLWPRERCAGHELAGKMLALLGFGAIARDTAALALANGMQVSAHDPFVDPDDPVWNRVANRDLGELFASADIISLHVPLTDGTRNLVNASRLAEMKAGAILINAARGGIVDEVALCDALKDGRIGGAALDVFTTEPLSAEAAAVFRDVPNLILTPHIAGVTAESNARVSAVTAEAVLKHLGSET